MRAQHQASAGEPARWLADTPWLQHDHAQVRLLALKLTQLRPGAWQKALACHAFVAELREARIARPARLGSLEVLRSGCADSRTRCTLLIALLRSLGIPARLLVVTRDSPGTQVFTQALIDGQWRVVVAAAGMVSPPGSGPAEVAVFDDLQDYLAAEPCEPVPGWATRGLQAVAAALVGRQMA